MPRSRSKSCSKPEKSEDNPLRLFGRKDTGLFCLMLVVLVVLVVRMQLVPVALRATVSVVVLTTIIFLFILEKRIQQVKKEVKRLSKRERWGPKSQQAVNEDIAFAMASWYADVGIVLWFFLRHRWGLMKDPLKLANDKMYPKSDPNYQRLFDKDSGKYFFGGKKSPCIFSNMYDCELKLHGLKFTSAEQAMHFGKAVVQCDIMTALLIYQCKTGLLAKALGRCVLKWGVCSFDVALWDKYSWYVVYLCVKAKFTDNVNLRNALLETGRKELLEAAFWDRQWGIGCTAQEALTTKTVPSKWGSNWLGWVLMEVRDEFQF